MVGRPHHTEFTSVFLPCCASISSVFHRKMYHSKTENYTLNPQIPSLYKLTAILLFQSLPNQNSNRLKLFDVDIMLVVVGKRRFCSMPINIYTLNEPARNIWLKYNLYNSQTCKSRIVLSPSYVQAGTYPANSSGSPLLHK